MKLVNLTPHDIHFITNDGLKVTIPKSGKIARVEQKTRLSKHINVEIYSPDFDINKPINIKIPILYNCFGAVLDLPDYDPDKEVKYIVSSIVRENKTHSTRDDLITPSDFVRNESGYIIGCKSFIE